MKKEFELTHETWDSVAVFDMMRNAGYGAHERSAKWQRPIMADL